MQADLALIRALEQGLPGATVSGLGARMTVEKVVGLADALDGPVGALTGTHGIAHLRLATESRIDPAHAQPFWGRPYPDIAVTHNGHITNYHKMRQKFEAQGFGFASRNDSEIIGIYLGQKTGAGPDAHGGPAGRRAGTGRLVLVHRRHAERAWAWCATRSPPSRCCTSRPTTQVALASEPQALHRLLGEDAVIKEIRPREVRTWERA